MRSVAKCVAVLLVVACAAGGTALGQGLIEDPLIDHSWVGGTGSQDWLTDTNWDVGTAPNDTLHSANLSVDLASDLNVSIGSVDDVTVAGVTLGGTSSAVTTEISGSGTARLVFHNSFSLDGGPADFDLDDDVDISDLMIWQRGFGMTDQNDNTNGDANLDTVVDGDDLTDASDGWIANFGTDGNVNNGGNGFIVSTGATGSVNKITANIYQVDEPIEVYGTSDLTVGALGSSTITFEGEMEETVLTSDASLSVMEAGTTVTIESAINLVDVVNAAGNQYGLNTSGRSAGTIVVKGVISGTDGDLRIGTPVSSPVMPLNTVRIESANSYTSETFIQRTNLEVANDSAFGTSRIRQAGPANNFGYNLIPVGADRTLANEVVLAQWQTIKGSQNLELTGHVTQTNNRGFVNMLEEGKTLTLSGRIDIWEDDEEGTERKIVFDGTGKTVLTGMIRDIPDLDPDGLPWGLAGEDCIIHKTGTGVLLIDMDSGDNDHDGETRVLMGNLHYADNASLNTGLGLIMSYGGAVGVDTGVATNAAFLAKIDSSSIGGLMIPTSESAATLNFTTTMAAAANMTVAAPEGGLTFTGTIVPANSTYGLGGGSGTLTLPNAQLTGANSLEVRNGGVVQLWGNNTYSGSTSIISRYTVSHQEQAAADSSNENDAVGLFLDRLVAPILEVDDLADGGQPSSIGQSSSAAENLFIHASTLKYVGEGDSTDRLFTIGTGGATIDASGTGALVFTNTGALGRDDAESRLGSLRGGAPNFNPDVVYALPDTSDLVVGMTVIDPDSTGYIQGGGCTGGAYCIPQVDEDDEPDPNTITGISENGEDIGLSRATAPDVIKVFSRMVFSTVERTLTLAGTNTGDNIMAPVIADSEGFPLEPDVVVEPGVVSVLKTGSGKWILTGNNTYSGDTVIEEGILSITNAYLDDDSAVELSLGAVLDLDFVGSDTIGSLLLDDVEQTAGTYGAIGSGATYESAYFTGSGLLNIAAGAMGAVAVVPEPTALALGLLAFLAVGSRRKRG